MPTDTEGGFPWETIVLAARAGVAEREILDTLGLDEEHVAALGLLARFKSEVARGNSVKRTQLQFEIDQRGKVSRRGAGSVNILALEARNRLKWDRAFKAQEPTPDLSSAKDRLRATLEKLAEQRSDIEGRKVTPEMIIFREAFGAWPEDGELVAAGLVPHDPLVDGVTPSTTDGRAS